MLGLNLTLCRLNFVGSALLSQPWDPTQLTGVIGPDGVLYQGPTTRHRPDPT